MDDAVEVMSDKKRQAERISDTNASGAFFSSPPTVSFEVARTVVERPEEIQKLLIDRIERMRVRQRERAAQRQNREQGTPPVVPVRPARETC